MFGLFKGGKRKRYRANAWERHLDPAALQQVYDDQGWSGALGEWRQRNVNCLGNYVDSVYEKEGRAATVLDVACFTGDYFRRLMELAGMGQKLLYTGVDVTSKYIETATNRCAAYPNASFRVASAFSLPFADKSFDIVFNSGMLIHVEDPIAAIREFVRVASKVILLETTADKAQREDFVEEGKSGPKFIDRVYRYEYIFEALANLAPIIRATEVPYQRHVSVLFEAEAR